MKLWADECVTPELAGVAHGRGYEATSNRGRGLLHELDPQLYPVVVREDWVFVTNNEMDFRALASEYGLHPGLIVLPQSTVAVQKEWFTAVLEFIEAHAAANQETPADWMVCRIVTFDEATQTVAWEWLPDEGPA